MACGQSSSSPAANPPTTQAIMNKIPNETSVKAFRASILHFTADPALSDQAHHWHEDGLLVIENGRVQAAGDYDQLKNTLPDGTLVRDYRGKIIMPGFIDTHIHYPQTDMIASPAPGLLPWLDTYTFPTERQFKDPEHARGVADFFLDELLRCGTTTAMVYCTVHPESVDAFFGASEQRLRQCFCRWFEEELARERARAGSIRLPQPVGELPERRQARTVLRIAQLIRPPRRRLDVRQRHQLPRIERPPNHEGRQQRHPDARDRRMQRHRQQVVARARMQLGQDLVRPRGLPQPQRPRTGQRAVVDQREVGRRLPQHGGEIVGAPARRQARTGIGPHGQVEHGNGMQARHRRAHHHDGRVDPARGEIDRPEVGREVERDVRMRVHETRQPRREPVIAERGGGGELQAAAAALVQRD
eukprot:gene28170-31820_t